jgi:hypothetical protein
MNKIYALSFILFLLIGHSTYGQSKHNNVWVFGDSTCVWFDDNNIPHGVLDTFLTMPNGSNVMDQATYCNQDGHLKMYADVCRLYNSNSQFISGSPSTGGSAVGRPILIPFNLDTNKLHFFNFSGFSGLPLPEHNTYRTIDLSLNNGVGAVYSTVYLSSDSSMVAGTVAIRHGNGRDWWIINHRRIGDRFMTYLLQNDSLMGPYFQNIGFYFNNPIFPYFADYPNSGLDAIIMDMASSGDGTRIAISIVRGILMTIDFDRCSGEFSNYRLLEDYTDTSYYYLQPSTNLGGYYSIEFAPRNRDLLYLSRNYQDTIFQYNLADSFPALTKKIVFAELSADSVPLDSNTLGAMATGPDGNIYIQRTGYDSYRYPNVTDSFVLYIARIRNPDLLWPGCILDTFAVRTHGRKNKRDLMNLVNYDLGAWSGSPCDTLTTTSTGQWLSSTAQVRIYPNPTNDKLNITWPVQGGYTWVLKSIAGVTLSSGTQETGNATISTAHLPGGMYFLEVHSAKEHKVEKVLVVR